MKETEIIEIAKNITTIIATIIAAVVAIIGLKAWRKQLKGKVEYDLARRYLIAVYKFREAFAIVRNPAIFNYEYVNAKKEIGNENPSDPKDADRYVYSIRWRKVNEAISALNVELLEAEVLWGVEAREIVADLFKCESKLYIVVRKYLEGRLKSDDDSDTLYNIGGNDAFSTEVNDAISKIENYLRKHLK